MKGRKGIFPAVILILLFFLFRVFYLATTDYNLADDEAYFWDWSRHPAASYYDQGPMVAWLIRLFTSLLPLSEFSVRLAAPICAALTAILLFLLTLEVTGSASAGIIVLLLFHLTPIGAAGGIIMTYYSPQILFMSLVAFFLWRIIRDEKARWWYPLGIALGLGFLSHHMFLFFTAEVFLFLLLSEKNKRWLKRKEPYLAILLMLVTASPLLIWNFNHNFVTFRHALGMISAPTKVTEPCREFLQYLVGQAGVYTPFFFLAVLYSLGVSGWRGIKSKGEESEKWLFLFCLSAPVIIFVGLLSLGGRTEANWPASGYLTGSLATVWIWEEKYRRGGNLTRILIKICLSLTLCLGLLSSAVAYYPSLSHHLGIKIDPKNDPANRLYGWKELGNKVSEIWEEMGEKTFVAASGYGQAAELAFYVKGHPEVYEIPTGRRFSQYDFWNKEMEVIGKDAVLADYRPASQAIENLFERVELAEKLVIRDRDSGLVRREFYIYRCYGYKGTKEALSKY